MLEVGKCFTDFHAYSDTDTVYSDTSLTLTFDTFGMSQMIGLLLNYVPLVTVTIWLQ